MVSNESTQWTPRYYYVMQNITSNKKYIGQTTQKITKYLGSGTYWKPHCKKYGGYKKSNIALLEYKWFTNEQEAKEWLDKFEEINPKYWLLEDWANQCPENTKDNPFYGPDINKNKMKNGTHPFSKKNITEEILLAQSKTRFGTETFTKNLIEKYGVDNIAKVTEIAKKRGKKSSITKKLNGTAKGSNNSNAKSVIVNNISFGTMKEASLYFDVSMHYLRKHNF